MVWDSRRFVSFLLRMAHPPPFAFIYMTFRRKQTGKQKKTDKRSLKINKVDSFFLCAARRKKKAANCFFSDSNKNPKRKEDTRRTRQPKRRRIHWNRTKEKTCTERYLHPSERKSNCDEKRRATWGGSPFSPSYSSSPCHLYERIEIFCRYSRTICWCSKEKQTRECRSCPIVCHSLWFHFDAFIEKRHCFVTVRWTSSINAWMMRLLFGTDGSRIVRRTAQQTGFASIGINIGTTD